MTAAWELSSAKAETAQVKIPMEQQFLASLEKGTSDLIHKIKVAFIFPGVHQNHTHPEFFRNMLKRINPNILLNAIPTGLSFQPFAAISFKTSSSSEPSSLKVPRRQGNKHNLKLRNSY